jgi:hypothetical protein
MDKTENIEDIDDVSNSRGLIQKPEDIIVLAALGIAAFGLYEMGRDGYSTIKDKMAKRKIKKEMEKELKLLIGSR